MEENGLIERALKKGALSSAVQVMHAWNSCCLSTYLPIYLSIAHSLQGREGAKERGEEEGFKIKESLSYLSISSHCKQAV